MASGSPPPIRSRISSLRSRTISRLAARSSGRHRPDRLGHPGHELVEDLALEPLDELVEPLARVAARGSRSPGGRGSARRRRAAGASSWSSRRAATSRSIVAQVRRVDAFGVARRSDASSSRRSTPGPLLVDDLVELAPDVAEDVVEPVALEHLLALAFEPIQQVRSPAMSPRVGSPVRQPRSISRRSASARSPSAITSSASASRISSASRSATCWLPSQARVARRAGERVGGVGPRGPSGCAGAGRRDRVARTSGPRSRGSGEYAVTGGRPSRPGCGPC